jgi:hypothetical protein
MKILGEQGHVHEFRGREERMDAIAKEYAKVLRARWLSHPTIPPVQPWPYDDFKPA